MRLSTRLRTVALLAVLTLTGTACGVLGLGDDTYEVEAEFSATYNLFPGSPVRVLGIDVGKIAAVDIGPGEDVVSVTMQIREDTTIPADAHALIVPEALLGERYVQFEPPYDGGAALEPGDVIPVERTQVPAEFDDVLEGLNKFVGGLEEDEVGRFVTNLADTLVDNGEQLGRTIDEASRAIGVLEENDDELVTLAGRLADLNETLSTRDEQIGELIEQWNIAAESLADDREEIDAALEGLLRMTQVAGDLLDTHREDLEGDIETLTRIGRTLNRNIDNVSLAILSSAELFRHADRVIDREHNWLPLVNHSDALADELTETIGNRLEGLCLGAGFSEEECEQLPLDDLLDEIGAAQLCLPGVVPCEAEDGTARMPVAEAIRESVERSEELTEALEQRRGGEDPGETTSGDTDVAGEAPGASQDLESTAGQRAGPRTYHARTGGPQR